MPKALILSTYSMITHNTQTHTYNTLTKCTYLIFVTTKLFCAFTHICNINVIYIL